MKNNRPKVRGASNRHQVESCHQQAPDKGPTRLKNGIKFIKVPILNDVLPPESPDEEPAHEPAALTPAPTPEPEPAPAASDHSAAINHFLRTARAGRHRAASSGERTAHRLAALLHDIGDDVALLDGATLEGFLALARAAAGPWRTDDAKHRIYTAIESAGKKL